MVKVPQELGATHSCSVTCTVLGVHSLVHCASNTSPTALASAFTTEPSTTAREHAP